MTREVILPEEIKEIKRRYMYPKYGTESDFVVCMDNSRARSRCSSRQLLMNKVVKLKKYLNEQGAAVDIIKEPYYEAAMQKAIIRITAEKDVLNAFC